MKTLFAVLTTLVLVFGTAQAESNERIGYAYDKETGRFLYSETHLEVIQDGRLIKATVAYRDSEGNVFAEKHVDFEKSPTMPDFHLVNVGNGHVEGARGASGDLTVHFRRESSSEVQEASVNRPRNGIIDAGFDRFIEENWDALVEGDVIEREFLIPSQLDFYTFEVERRAAEASGEFVFELRVKSMLLQMFVRPVLVHYDARTRSLLKYEGISNIRNDDGENFDVRIEFPVPERIQVSAESEQSLN